MSLAVPFNLLVHSFRFVNFAEATLSFSVVSGHGVLNICSQDFVVNKLAIEFCGKSLRE